MKVIDHAPGAWFLYQEGEALYLGVNCSHGVAGYDALIRLEAEEAAAWRQLGHGYADDLAAEVYASDPGAVGGGSRFAARNLAFGRSEERKRATAAVEAWRSEL